VDETPARGERRRQLDEGEYACARRKTTGSMSGSAQGRPKRQAAMPGTMKTKPSRVNDVCTYDRYDTYLADKVARVANDERWRQTAFPSRFLLMVKVRALEILKLHTNY
jgi:hypothetical protein